MRHRLSVRASAVLMLVALAATAAFGATTVSASAPAGVVKAADLFAGKTTDVGDVFVWNDVTNLYVELDIIAPDWCMSESHVAAGMNLADIPQANGNPIPGAFPYGDTYTPCEAEDTFTIPLAGLGANPYVAVHAKVLHQTSMWVYSDAANTMVTASSALPAGKVLPFASSDAWEAFGDPVDPTPSVWDNGVGVGTFQAADWIWQSERVQTPTVDEVVTFQRAFTVPGPVAPGSWMKVTTDDAYTASLNGTTVAADTWPNWPSVETASSFAPVAGANTLVFVSTNSDESLGLAGTIDSNPGGLIYEAKVYYYNRSESAWAGTAVGVLSFSGKNWATYFRFNVQILTGDLWMGDELAGGAPDQHLTFSLVDLPDGGLYGYVNIDAAPVVDYAGAPSCVDYDTGTPNTLRFAYQIPAGEGGLTGLWIVWKVTGGATPTAGFSVAADGPGATTMCQDGAFAPANSYAVYDFLLNF